MVIYKYELIDSGAYQYAERSIHVDNVTGFEYNVYKLEINKFDNLLGT